VDTKRYFKSFQSYVIPFVPIDEIDFAETENLRVFYIGSYDEAGVLMRFAKYFRTATDITNDFQLTALRAAGNRVYFESRQTLEGAEVGQVVDYVATRSLLEYFAGVVDETGRAGMCSLIRRTLMFEDSYAYWPNGKLQTRGSKSQDGTVTIRQYDQQGGEVAPDNSLLHLSILSDEQIEDAEEFCESLKGVVPGLDVHVEQPDALTFAATAAAGAVVGLTLSSITSIAAIALHITPLVYSYLSKKHSPGLRVRRGSIEREVNLDTCASQEQAEEAIRHTFESVVEDAGQ
jgi:hypothetical protein